MSDIFVENRDQQHKVYATARNPKTGKEEVLVDIGPTDSLANYVGPEREVILRDVTMTQARKREAARPAAQKKE